MAYDLGDIEVHHVAVKNPEWYAIPVAGKHTDTAVKVLRQLGFTADRLGTTMPMVFGNLITSRMAHQAIAAVNLDTVRQIG